LGAEQQMVLELRPAHDPTKAYGFVGVVVSLKDLSSSIWLWHQTNGKWGVQKVIEIPAESANPDQLPPLLKGFKAAPPLLTDINLSVDDRYLYASNWGTGEVQQYDVSDPFHPKLTSSVHIGGIIRRAAHPQDPEKPLNGGPQMIEVSRDGRRAYFTNSLYAAWDKQFYPDGIQGWMAKLDVGPEGIALDRNFLVNFGDLRSHQARIGECIHINRTGRHAPTCWVVPDRMTRRETHIKWRSALKAIQRSANTSAAAAMISRSRVDDNSRNSILILKGSSTFSFHDDNGTWQITLLILNSWKRSVKNDRKTLILPVLFLCTVLIAISPQSKQRENNASGREIIRCSRLEVCFRFINRPH
jgi:hypothetical protein